MAQGAVPRPKSKLAQDLDLDGGGWMPKLIYGTAWKGERTADLVYTAIKVGFRGIDTAAQPKHYREDLVAEGVKRAIAEGLVKREDLFIQTKFTPIPGQDPSNMPYPADAPLVKQMDTSIANSLKLFSIPNDDGNEVGYLDSLLLHSPLATAEDNRTASEVMEAYRPFVISHLGVSNTPAPPADGGKVVIQNRFVAQTGFDAALRGQVRDDGVVYQAFWVLTGNPGLLRSAPVTRLADAAAVSVQVALYALVLGLGRTAVLDGTTSETHMREDLEGVEKVGLWAESDGGRAEWDALLEAFKEQVGDGKHRRGGSFFGAMTRGYDGDANYI